MSRSTIIKIVLGVLALAAIVALFRVLPVAEWLKHFQAWIRGVGPIGYVIYALVYAVCVVFLVPASLLTLGAGAIFGVVAGTIVVVIGATLGATLAFLLARTVLRRKVEEKVAQNAKFRALDRAIANEGVKIVLLIRLAPIFPFTYINYAFGVTGIRLVPYIVATLIGIVPATFAFVYLGSAAASVATERTGLIVKIAGAVLAIVASIFVGRVAVRAIKAGDMLKPVSEVPDEQSPR